MHRIGLVVLVALSGCLPSWPTVTPGVSGHLMLNGAPVEGVKVYVVDRLQDKSCVASKLEATTDMSGAFSIASTRAFEWNVPGDRIVSWSLCVNYKDEWIVGYE
jgi:hypothetical protein